MLAHLGATLPYLEGNVGPSWGYVGPSWGYVGPSWGYVGPFWGLCCPILGAMLPHLGTMFAHLEAYVDPPWVTGSKKGGKNGRAKYPVKRRIFWPYRVGRRLGRRPLSPTERREPPSAMPRPGGPWPDLRANAPRRLRRISRPSISSQCGGWKAFGWGPASEIYSLRFLEKKKNRNFVGNRRLFWGASECPKAPAKGFSRRTAANFNLWLHVKTPLCKDFSV